MTISAIANILGGKRTLKRDVVTPVEMAAVTRDGLAASIVDVVASTLALPRVAITQLLGISERTLSRRMTSHSRLTAIESDRVVRLARMLAMAQETLGDLEKAGRWLKTPNRALEGDRPLDRLDTDTGVRAVEQILGRIEYGMYS